ncbi:MAG: carbohydrate kinase [Zetaproteobacteria bacterium CG12_big_fil_rev_8_21_14_0_65_55_1124]|nr:MAG: carbohydrate kinase [Zetaproteobacteria bacterium CG1_02_55_237]PIS20279.1 MAG: carbohydrate kinase [Zetaproteobacteria bacterium CG08_land_8_20_14_0_20_55_17]PIW43156.1 MAG: carbohydrate kinase [Zetaproteobacteria bacterium CG12_big_fil_rev_8_21_14_0_65_55_1124]PIY52120.1 MAG: carbohydrate kinase [Zetaproteobacteria bacterium CG_4_10_14_0_8_um_filter_55_43]PIZ38132.1 MAG: carbohydrate kinase [Zetaproteobacteria bacterium CG_4_10_14_0_2_um_filter_55_20]PJB79495.1 MAG: carbohydrate kina
MLDVLCVGHASFDITMSASHHPGSDEKMLADALMLGGGGPAANAAVQVTRLGGSAGFCGYLGHDIFGEEHVDELTHEGVDTGLVVRGGHTSPVSQILAKPDGSRSVVNFKGDTPWLPADAVELRRIEALAPSVILFDGHEPLLSEVICNWARENNIATVLDAGSLHRGTRELAAQVDFLVASEKFARQYCDLDDPEACLVPLAAMAATVVITLGERGLIWNGEGKTGHLPAYPVEPVDSTGAGDSFHGAFALAVARDMTWDDTLRFASAAGALTCSRLGARAALPDGEQVRNLIGSAS